MKKRSLSVFAASICLLTTLLALPFYAHSAVPAKPNMFVWASMEVATAVYIQYSAVGEGILKKFDIKLRTVPVRADIARVTLARMRQADAFLIAGATHFCWKGISDFANRAWGPQPIRTVWLAGRQYPSSAVTRKGSGVKTPADLKGKRVPRYVGSPGLQSLMSALLAFANLTWDDVKPVEVGSYSEALTQMIAGKLDVCHADAVSGKAMELAASPAGLIWIPLPKEDVAGWKRYNMHNAVYFPIQPKHGVNIPADNTMWLATSAYPTLYSYDFADEDKVYWMTKAVAEAFPEYKDSIKPNMQWWAPDIFVKIKALTPYHKGTIRYLKEKGMWSGAMEKNNNMLLAREKQLKAAWENATLEAEEKKIKDKNFPKFWLEKQWD